MTGTETAAGHRDGGARRRCPHWCVSSHGVHRGEEDWVHLGEPLTVAHDVVVRLCMSVDPATGAVDGPYVLVGTTEHTPARAAAIGAAMLALARAGAATARP